MSAAEAWRELDQLFGRQPAVATIGEIMRAFIQNSPEAAHMLVARIMEDALTSPVLGTYGDRWARRSLTPEEFQRMHALERTYEMTPNAPAYGYRSIQGSISQAHSSSFHQREPASQDDGLEDDPERPNWVPPGRRERLAAKPPRVSL